MILTELPRPEMPPTEAPGAGALFPSLFHCAGYGAARNLHLLVEDRLRPINRWLRDVGGLNRHNEPNYRVVWGWENPGYYGMNGGKFLEFFHFEWWRPMEGEVTESEWDEEQQMIVRESGGTREARPYPRHGEYKWIAACEWGVGKPGQMTAVFRWPDSGMISAPGVRWYEYQLFDHMRRRARSRAAIAEEVARTQALAKQEERERNERLMDENGDIRQLVEDEVEALYRNPTLRTEPEFMLSPAVARKRVNHWPTASNG